MHSLLLLRNLSLNFFEGSDWFGSLQIKFMCLSHSRLFWRVMPRYVADFTFIKLWLWSLWTILVFFLVILRMLHLSGWKCINQSPSHLHAASKSDCSDLESSVLLELNNKWYCHPQRVLFYCDVNTQERHWCRLERGSVSGLCPGEHLVLQVLFWTSSSSTTVWVLSSRNSVIQFSALHDMP